MADHPFDIEPIRDAIAAADAGMAMVTGFVVLAATVNTDGSRSVNMMSDCAEAWQVLGLLHHGLLVTEKSKYERRVD